MTAVGIVGNGVVGNATGKTFEKCGLEVRYWDVNPDRSTHSLYKVLDTRTVFVCLPTPSKPDGSCDLTALTDFFDLVKVRWFKPDTTFVIRSTVPVGFTKTLHTSCGVTRAYHWPEFLNASTAEEDAAKPRCVILGKAGGFETPKDGPYRLIMDCFPWLDEGLCVTSDESEAIKLFVNTFFAVKNAAFNEFRLFADAKGLDWEAVVRGVLADGRVNPVHTQVPGPDGKRGFGGACLPKDLASFVAQCGGVGLSGHMANTAGLVNKMVRPKE